MNFTDSAMAVILSASMWFGLLAVFDGLLILLWPWSLLGCRWSSLFCCLMVCWFCCYGLDPLGGYVIRSLCCLIIYCWFCYGLDPFRVYVIRSLFCLIVLLIFCDLDPLRSVCNLILLLCDELLIMLWSWFSQGVCDQVSLLSDSLLILLWP